MKNSMSLILLIGVIALSPWQEGQAQTGSQEGSTGGSGTTGIPDDTQKHGKPGSSGMTGTESDKSASPPGTPGGESGTRNQESPGSTGTKRRGGSDTDGPSH